MEMLSSYISDSTGPVKRKPYTDLLVAQTTQKCKEFKEKGSLMHADFNANWPPYCLRQKWPFKTVCMARNMH